MGKGLLAGASAVGLGALCFYGAGMSNDVGAIDRARSVFHFLHAKMAHIITYIFRRGKIIFVFQVTRPTHDKTQKGFSDL